MASLRSPTSAETTAATIRISTSVPVSCSRMIRHGRSAAALHELVRPVAAKPRSGFGGAQALVGCNFQACGHLGWFQQIPGSLCMRGSFRQIGFHGRHSFLDL